MASQHMKLKTASNLLEIVNHLEHLVASLKEGNICIKKSEKSIFLKPREPVHMEMKAHTKTHKASGREKVCIELTWIKNMDSLIRDDTFTIYCPAGEATQTPSDPVLLQEKETVNAADPPPKQSAPKQPVAQTRKPAHNTNPHSAARPQKKQAAGLEKTTGRKTSRASKVKA